MSLYLGNNLIAPNQSNAANKSLSNLDATGEKHFVNKSQLTNCILEAPNGVATYSGDTITFKQGLKFLIPNGLNTDGTLNNIEHTLEQDINFTQPSNRNGTYILFLRDNNTTPIWQSKDTYYYWMAPVQGKSFLYFDTETNRWQQSLQGGAYTYQNQCPILIATITNGTITSIRDYYDITLLKFSDRKNISGWGMPSNKNIAITVGAAGTQYTAPANGWFSFSTNTGSTSVGYVYLNNATTGVYSYNMGNAEVNIQGSVPAKKGDKVSLWWTGTNLSITAFRFIYAKGSESEAS